MNDHRKENTIELYKKIGKQIAKFRMEKNLTQLQLSEKLGIKQQTLAAYEVADRRLPISMLKPIADALFVRIEDLLDLNKPGQKLKNRLEFIKRLPENKQTKNLELYELPPIYLGNEYIGKRIARLRSKKNLTQKDVAKKIGIDSELVSNYESGKLKLYDEMVTRFAIALEVSADELLGLKDYYVNEKKQKYSGKKEVTEKPPETS